MKRSLINLLKPVVAWLLVLPLPLKAQFDSLPNSRDYDKRGINVFETPEQEIGNDKGLKIKAGGGVVQQFQSLSHSNSIGNKAIDSLYDIGPRFAVPMINCYLNTQIKPGIYLKFSAYLYKRYQHTARIKEGYLQLNRLTKTMTVKAGLMELNYGDAHFRRSDGGNAIYNPFIENHIAEAFTTGIATEVYIQKNGFFVMGGVAGRRRNGNYETAVMNNNDERISNAPAVYAKAALDHSVDKWLRIRLSGSWYHNGNSRGNTLFAGDLAGAHYYWVMEKAQPGTTVANAAFSGRINPYFCRKVDAFQCNGFIKLLGFEVFATWEAARGRMTGDESMRGLTQFSIDWVCRFDEKERFFIASRYNAVDVGLPGIADRVRINRAVLCAGYFISKNSLLKAEYTDQQYRHFPENDYRNGGNFNGFVIQMCFSF